MLIHLPPRLGVGRGPAARASEWVRDLERVQQSARHRVRARRPRVERHVPHPALARGETAGRRAESRELASKGVGANQWKWTARVLLVTNLPLKLYFVE
eukprot:scaffold70542_cov33-Tisochrysis_lutea.AAC.1